MPEYILNDKKVFETFSRTDKVLSNGQFPIMSQFEDEEIEFWSNSFKKYLSKDDTILEMGAGTGRVLRALLQLGFRATGFDNNRLFIDYSKKRGLDIFYLDATKKVPAKHKNKYNAVGIALNTLFNFPKPIRKKWITSAYDLLVPGGLLVFSVYCDSDFSDSEIKERVGFYNTVIQPPKDHSILFFETKSGRGIKMVDTEGKIKWFSEWMKQDDIIKEIRSWKKFRTIHIDKVKCGIALNVLLKKSQ